MNNSAHRAARSIARGRARGVTSARFECQPSMVVDAMVVSNRGNGVAELVNLDALSDQVLCIPEGRPKYFASHRRCERFACGVEYGRVQFPQVSGFKDVSSNGSADVSSKARRGRECPSCLAEAVTRCRKLFPWQGVGAAAPHCQGASASGDPRQRRREDS